MADDDDPIWKEGLLWYTVVCVILFWRTTKAARKQRRTGEGGMDVEEGAFEVVTGAAVVGRDDACSATLRFAPSTTMELDTAQALRTEDVVCWYT
jgi:hypothetical protein